MEKITPYVVTNIKLKEGEQVYTGKVVMKDFEIPKDVEQLDKLITEYGIEASDKHMYEIYARAVIFKCYQLEFDYQPLSIECEHQAYADGFYLSELVLESYDEYTTAELSFEIPKAFIALLTDEDFQNNYDNVNMAIFMNMTTALPLNINVKHSLTEQILTMMLESMLDVNAAAPNNISEQAYELAYDRLDGLQAESISHNVFELASDLVNYPPVYL